MYKILIIDQYVDQTDQKCWFIMTPFPSININQKSPISVISHSLKTSPPGLSEWLVQKVQQQQWLVAKDKGKPECLDKICSKDRSDKDQTLPDNGKAMTRQYQTSRHWQATRQLPGSCKGQETPCSVSSQPTRRRPPSPESSSPEQVFPSSISKSPMLIWI